MKNTVHKFMWFLTSGSVLLCLWYSMLVETF